MATCTVQSVDSNGAVTQITGTDKNKNQRKRTDKFVITAWVFVVVWALVSWAIFTAVDPTPIAIAAGYGPLAGLVIVAGALERFLEPISHWVGPDTTEKKETAEEKSAEAKKEGATPTASVESVKAKADEAATAKTDLEEVRNQRAAIFWALASCLGMLVPACLGLFLLGSVATTPVNRFFDMLVTGLSIGAGTKPLHDLIASIEKKSETASGGAAATT